MYICLKIITKLTRPMKATYQIHRHKFFDTHERKKICRITEEKSILDKAKGRITWQVRWMLVHLAFNSGLRVSEIAALKIKHLKLTSKPPSIFVENSKRGKSRDVYIDRELTAHLKEFLKNKKDWGQKTDNEAPLFSGRGGGHYSTTALTLSFKEAVKSSNLRNNLSIHSARHTYATLLYYATKDLIKVKKQLGHSSLNMTSLYADILPESNGETANKILEVL